MDHDSLYAAIGSALPEEKDILGKRLFSEIVDKSSAGEVIDLPKPSGGHAIDIASVLEVVKTSAEFAIAVYGIFEIYQKTKKKPDSKLSDEKKNPKYSGISEEKLDDLIAAVEEQTRRDV
jgi:hypothetical protein